MKFEEKFQLKIKVIKIQIQIYKVIKSKKFKSKKVPINLIK